MTLVLDKISLKRGPYLFFEKFSLVCSLGDMIEILGPNGCGKTSLLKIIAGYLPVFQGKIISTFPDKPFYMPVHSGMDLALSPYENLAYICTLNQQPYSKIPESLEKLNMTCFQFQPFHTLSSGQQQRIYLASLFIVPRQLWLLDEPTLSLDAEGKKIFKDMCYDHCRNQGSIIIASPQSLEIGKSVSLIDYYSQTSIMNEEWI